MAIAVRAAMPGVNNTAGALFTVDPAVAEGDLLLAVVDVNSLSFTLAGPTDASWTLLATSQGDTGGGSQYAALFSKRATASDANASVTFPVTPTGSTKAGSMVAYYSTTGGIIDVGPAAFRGETTSTATHATPIISVAVTAETWVVTAIGKKGTTVTSLTPPASPAFTLRQAYYANGSSNNATAIADRVMSSSGSTTGAAWTANVANTAATTFVTAIYEGAPPPPPALALRIFNGIGWDLAGG